MLKRIFKYVLPRRLLGRSIFIIVAPMVVLQIIAAYAFYALHWDTITRRLANGIAADAGMVADFIHNNPGEDDWNWLMQAVGRMELTVSLDPAGNLPDALASQASFPFFEEALEEALTIAMHERVKYPFVISRQSERDLLLNIQVPEGIVNIRAPMKRLFSASAYAFVLWLVGTAAILLVISTIFMRNQVKSVRKLAEAMDAFGKGREVMGFKPEGAAEVRLAASAFNLMRERIRRQIVQRTEMLAGVSHDLRTPITRMKLQLAILGENHEGVKEIGEDIAEMEKMIEGYLAFARGEGNEAAVLTDLKAMLSDIVIRFRRDDANVDLHCPDELWLPLRPDAMRRCFTNLIANAVRYASKVIVRIELLPEAVDVLFDDDGPGIPKERREDVFKAFFRLDPSRNSKTGGVGLGLTIARDVIRGHGGEIFLEESQFGGLRARVRLPL